MQNRFIFSFALILALLFLGESQALAQAPTVETFKQVITKRLHKLMSDGYSQRDIRFVSVLAGKAKNGAYPFRATIVVRDYGAGYPKNRYYGSTCVGKLVDQDYYMLPDDFGGWKVKGAMTPDLNTKKCKNNLSEGATSIPADSLEGTPAGAGTPAPPPPVGKTGGGSITTGEWACYGSGGRALIGLGFKVNANGTYTDLDNKNHGTYSASGSTLTFKGGHLDGQIGHSVGGGRFNIGTTTCEPYR